MITKDRQSRVEWYANFAERFGITQDPEFNLLTELKLDPDRFREIRDATIRYISAPLEDLAGTTLGQEGLEIAVSQLANHSPNGLVVPKQEIQLEFNLLHQAVSGWFRSLSIDDLLYRITSPLAVRLVKGQRNAEEEARPLASTKLHADIWIGNPSDMVVISIPVLGDIERTTIEYFHPPDDFEKQYMRDFSDYDHGNEIEGRCKKYPLELRMGYAYFHDSILPHKTAKNQGKERVTIQFEFRRASSEAARRDVEALCRPERLVLYRDLAEWYQTGTTKFMKFTDTYSDALLGIFQSRRVEGAYELVNSL